MVQIDANKSHNAADCISVVMVNEGKSMTVVDPALTDAYVNHKRPPEQYKSHQWVVFHDTEDGFVQYSANNIRDDLYSK